MNKATIQVRQVVGDPGWPHQQFRNVDRWVCNRSHPHPTEKGATECEALRAAGATDQDLYDHFNAEVAAFNA